MTHSLHHPDNPDPAKLLQELDRDSKSRTLTGGYKTAMTVLFVLYSVTMIAMALVVSGATQYTRLPVFVGMTLFVGYLKYPASKRDALRDNYFPWYDIVLAVASLGVYFYYAIAQQKVIQMANRIGTLQIVLGIVGILLLVELCRRSTGIPLIVVVGLFTVYGAWWLTNNNPKTALRNLIYNLFYNLNCGIFSSPITVCASFIVLFIILGSFLEKTGIGTFFVDLANSVAGASVGGPAKVAVISSALEGMYSGSSVANTVGSGSITIPTMKRVGYRPEFAAAVEAAASTGGQIMPPIMGAAAFLMAEITGIPYASIVVAAILPAILYFTGIFLMVHFEGKRLGLKGLPKDSIPNFFRLLLKSGYLLLPVIILVICMNYYTAGMSACFAILFALIISLIGKDKHDLLRSVGLPLIPLATLVILWQVVRVGMGTSVFVAMVVAVLCSFLTKSAILTPGLVAEGLQGGAASSIGVAVACAMAGIISGVVSMTALGTTLVAVIVPLAQKSIFLALFCTMLACIVLGMGVPTTANYVIMATITAPILVKMGIPLLAAHMFVFYFGIVADITPPVALAAYAGSAIAHSNPLKTGVTATKLAIGAFIIPYIFALNPNLLLLDNGSPLSLIGIMVTSVIGMAGIAMGMTGYAYAPISWWMRVMLLVGGVLLIKPDPITDVLGLLLIAIPFISQIIQSRKAKAAPAE
ncbi:MAG: TRAP transporter permease [Angelakisella sp.]